MTKGPGYGHWMSGYGRREMKLLGAGTTEVKEQRGQCHKERGRTHVGCVSDLEGKVKG